MKPRSPDSPANLLHELLVARELSAQPCYGASSLLRASQRPIEVPPPQAPQSSQAQSQARATDDDPASDLTGPAKPATPNGLPRTFVRLPTLTRAPRAQQRHVYPPARNAACCAPVQHATSTAMLERLGAVTNAGLVAAVASTAKRLAKTSSIATTSASAPGTTAAAGAELAGASHPPPTTFNAMQWWTLPDAPPLLPKSVTFVCEPVRDDLLAVHDGPVVALFQTSGSSTKDVHSVTFSHNVSLIAPCYGWANSHQMVCTGDHGELVIADLQHCAITAAPPFNDLRHPSIFVDCQVNEQATAVLTSCADSTLCMFDLRSFEEILTIRLKRGLISSAAKFVPGSDELVVCTAGSSALLFDIRNLSGPVLQSRDSSSALPLATLTMTEEASFGQRPPSSRHARTHSSSSTEMSPEVGAFASRGRSPSPNFASPNAAAHRSWSPSSMSPTRSPPARSPTLSPSNSNDHLSALPTDDRRFTASWLTTSRTASMPAPPGAHVAPCSRHIGEFFDMNQSTDEQYDKALKMYVRPFTGHDPHAHIDALNVSRDGRFLITSTVTGEHKAWNLSTCKGLLTLQHQHASSFSGTSSMRGRDERSVCPILSRDNGLFVAAKTDNSLEFWDSSFLFGHSVKTGWMDDGSRESFRTSS
ncbi:hypothetical protein, variant [Capsaspora owczarzaki ATCC 30864]|uniref:Uncharacterized protein n=1 Tax=Capsaspora owczarzaki (strain ATCC 30864) TaxID=595528 RepID=A0A0D2X5E8_CAPO3|nr:hypothetical protein, variant [Capsaspora owczarzaki ATCC 30864]